MAEAYSRSKYISYGKKKNRKTNIRGEGKAGRKVLIQLYLTVLIFTFLAVISTSTAPAAEYIKDKVKSAIKVDWYNGEAFTGLKNSLSGLLPGKSDKLTPDENEENNEENEIETTIPYANLKADDEENNLSEVLGVRTLDLVKPVEGKVTGLFGEWENTDTGELEFNCGIDIEITGSANVFTVLPGKVVDAGTDEEYGMYIRISHGDGLETVYANLTENLAVTGSQVKKGENIAVVRHLKGSSMNYLHFEIWQDDMPYNPLTHLEQFYSIEPVG